MKKNMKIFAWVLSVILLVSMTVGCNKDSSNVTSKSENNTTGTSSTYKDQDTAASEEKKPVTIKWFQAFDGKAAATMKSYDEVASWKAIEEKMGVDIEWLHPPVGQENEQFNLMIASQQLPDIIYWGWTDVAGGPAKMIQDNVIVRLNEIIEKSAPNYKRVLDSNDNIRRQVMMDDGTYYMFARLFPNPESMSYNGFQIRKDWLDKLNLDIPTTIDEWYNVLTAFKNNIKSEDGEEIIPFLSMKTRFSAFSTAWGIRTGFYPDPKTGKIKYGFIEPEFKDFLITMNKWYNECLIDSEFASVDSKSFEAKVTSGIGGAYHGNISGNMGRFLNLMKDVDPEFNIVGVPWPIGPAGEPYSSHDSLIRAFVGKGAAITTTTKHLEEVVKLLDFCYSEEGNILLNWGIEGESYVVENGKRKMTELITNNPNGLPTDQAMIRYASPGSDAPAVCDHEARKFLIYLLPQQAEASKIWASGNNALLMPIITPNFEESNKFANIMSEINTYTDEMLTKFVMGNESLDNFDKFVKTIEDMGIQEAIKIQQAAFDRFNARK